MSLKEKLGGLTQKLETEKKEKKQTEQDEQLKPVRANIKELEKNIKSLDLIKNSLDFKELNRPDEHIGMKDYAERTGKKVKSKSEEIDTLILGNKEALDTLGIEDRDQLSVHPEFAEEPEVIEYKKATKQGEELKMSDTKLKERLTKLGIEIDSENFSYESASEAVGEKLENINKELTQEKLKTPEGREEIINNLANKFEKNIGRLELNSISGPRDKSIDRGYEKDQPDYSYGFGMDRDDFNINFKGKKTEVTNWSNLRLIPDNFKDMKATLGDEIAREALEKAYQNKVDDAFMAPGAPLGEAIKLRAFVESFGPEKRQLAEKSLETFDGKKEELLKLLRAKSKELKSKGIEFDPEYASGYGSKYKDLFQFGKQSYGSKIEDAKSIISTFYSRGDYNSKLFPDYDFTKLVDIAERRIGELNEAINIVNGIVDKESANKFLGDDGPSVVPDIYHERCPLGKFHKQFLHNDFQEIAEFKSPKNISYNEKEKLSSSFKSYKEAVQYLDKEIAVAEDAKKRVAEKISEAVEYLIIRSDLEKQYGSYVDSHYRDILDSIEGSKKYARKSIESIVELQARLPQEEPLRLSGTRESRGMNDTVASVSVPSKIKEYELLSQNKENAEKELKGKDSELEEEKNAEPWLGKGNWRKKIKELEEEIEKGKKEIQRLKDEYDKAVKDAYYYLEVKGGSEVRDIIYDYSAAGKASEIFEKLKEKLMEFVDKEAPADLVNKVNRLEDLRNSLSGNK
jgi:hypothetical protein